MTAGPSLDEPCQPVVARLDVRCASFCEDAGSWERRRGAG